MIIEIKQTMKKGRAKSWISKKAEDHFEKYKITSLYVFKIKVFSFWSLISSNL